MGRWRPPQQRGSHYITPEGFLTLKQESHDLWQKRREVTVAVTAAAAEGDRSENAEYIYRKKQLREIDRRFGYLQKRLNELSIVDRIPDNLNQVFFGAWVTVEDNQGQESCYRIVGPDEFDTDERYISMDAPVAKALMKKKLDDIVAIQLPGGEKQLTIVDIHYSPPE